MIRAWYGFPVANRLIADAPHTASRPTLDFLLPMSVDRESDEPTEERLLGANSAAGQQKFEPMEKGRKAL
jgi:hypothetical protein